MHVSLNNQNRWTERGKDTLDEYIEFLCSICLSEGYLFEVTIEYSKIKEEEVDLFLCAGCLTSLTKELANQHELIVEGKGENIPLVNNIRIYPI